MAISAPIPMTSPTPDRPTPRVPDPEPAGARPRVIGGLAAAVDAGLRALDDLRAPRREAVSGDLERTLRTAVQRDRQRPVAPLRTADSPGAVLDAGVDRLAGVAIAVEVACAHLGAGNLAEARLALEGAYDALPHGDRRIADPPGRADDALGRDLRERAVLAQAVGILTQSTGASPSLALAALRGHADRHRFVVVELAGDIVAGRVAPSAIAACRPSRRHGRG